ncbi:chemotaxis protein [Stenotrophomonas maltophilia]|jgi:hypothetical protein|uniref:Chemotaxis protein n=1 Tax=Stenotrophomonas maltophilia TaxID=40324 RepID=A0A246HJP8_STEMA|nr:chemotaxis protein [Stenotrophomonas maltophilia]OWQ51380.1 chemotaxis protein [Stenotrophomonas maltophilia]
MPIPILIGLGVAAAASLGAKKAYDGYKKHSESDDIVESARSRYQVRRDQFDRQEKKTMESLDALGNLELSIGKEFERFSTLSAALLQQLNQSRDLKLEVKLPRHTLQKVEAYTYSAVGVLGSIAGAGAGGVAAGFAVYGGVMTFAAASTGTAISSLAGVAATNATLAAIGGGSLAAGGLGMAGGTAILGAAVAAPILAIAGWAYDSHGEMALKNAKQASAEVDRAIPKLEAASTLMAKTDLAARKVKSAVEEIQVNFDRYLDTLEGIDNLIGSLKRLGRDVDEELAKFEEEIMLAIGNGYALAAILTDIISTPLFKVKIKNDDVIVNADGMPEMETDADGSLILNSDGIDDALDTGRNSAMRFNAQ